MMNNRLRLAIVRHNNNLFSKTIHENHSFLTHSQQQQQHISHNISSPSLSPHQLRHKSSSTLSSKKQRTHTTRPKILPPLLSSSFFNHDKNKSSNNSNNDDGNNKNDESNRKRRRYIKYGIGSLGFLLVVSLLDVFEPVISQKLFVRIELDEHDEAFDWVMNWLNQHDYTQQCTNLTVFSGSQYHKGMNGFLSALMQVTFSPSMTTANKDGDEDDSEDEGDSSKSDEQKKKKKDQVLFVPGQGRHFLFYNGYFMWIDYSKEKNSSSSSSSGDSSGGKDHLRNLTITFWNPNIIGGARVDAQRRKLVTDIILEAKEQYNAHKVGKTTIHCPDRYCERWEEVVRKPKRPLSSVILQQPETLTGLLGDVKDFVANEKFYSERGIPYRRGYLLYGPPGSGKTSTVQVIAGELGFDIYMLNVSSTQMTDEKLNYLLHQAPRKSIVLLEDVDSCVSATERSIDASDLPDDYEEFHAGSYGMNMEKEKVTVSGLLNAIDGVGAQEGRILFFTTNHANRLQKALMRPGRIDIKREIGYITDVQAKNLFLSFYRDCSNTANVNEIADTFVNELRQIEPVVGGVTPALLQGLFMENRNHPENTVGRLPTYLAENMRIVEHE